MSSSTSSSEHKRFLLWVLLALLLSDVLLYWLPFGGPVASRRSHERAARAVGAEADFLLVGDSKVSSFSRDCLLTGTQPWRGLAFTSNAVSPVFYFDALRAIAAENPGFAPKVVFISIGSNNFNANGLHMQREYTLNNVLDLAALWDLTAAQGEWMSFITAILSRMVPVYGKRVLITHLEFDLGRGDEACKGLDPDRWDDPRYAHWKSGGRKPIIDRQYMEITRRSILQDFVYSPIAERALVRIIEQVRGWGGVPVIVLLPVSEEMNALRTEMVGDAFDGPIRELAARLQVQILDLRSADYDLKDVNHLSQLGARDVARDHFVPIVGRVASRGTAAQRLAPAG